MRSWVFGRAAAAALAMVAAPAIAAAPIPADAKIAPDPALRSGTFPNGLRYLIMSNPRPSGALSIRLAVGVGSYVESEEERGYAHFIEHMAFRSTKQVPNGVLDSRFGTLGVALGRDQNAVTQLTSTIYRVDLPKGGLPAVTTILEWMRGAADGINFTAETVGLERGAVLSELRESKSPIAEMQQAIAAFQLPGTRSVTRDPGGTEERVRGATAERLRAFHDRWYRPDNATLIITGDAPAEALVKAAEAAFGSWRSQGPAPVRPEPLKAPPPRGAEALTLADPSLPRMISACRITPAETGPYTLERERRTVYSNLWTDILNKRLLRSSTQTGSPMLGAAAFVNRDVPDGTLACLGVAPTETRWKDSLAQAEAELRRFAKDGPTKEEVDASLETMRGRINAVIYQGSQRQTPELADGLVEAALRNFAFPHPSEAMRILNLVTQDVTPQDVKAAFDRDWSGAGPFLALSGPEPLAREALLAAWQENEKAAPLSAYAQRETVAWPYWDFGKEGRVEKTETLHSPDYTRFRFKNGTILNFRPSSLEPGAVEIRVRFGNGEAGLDNATRMPVQLATTLFPTGGLGKLDYQDIESALTGTTWKFTLSAFSSAYVLSSGTLADQMDVEMRVLAAFMVDPGFRPAMDEKLPTTVDMVYRMVGADPTTVANQAMEEALFPGQLALPPRAEIEKLHSKDFERMLRPALTQSPVEVTIVGDVTEKMARDAVASTFGALAPRPPRAAPAGPGPFRRFPSTLPREVTGYHNGPANKAAAILIWPLWVASPERRHEEYAVDLLGVIFQSRLLQQVRGVLGKVYSPSVSTPMPDFADQGYVAATLETSTTDLAQVIDAARAIARELVAGRMTQEELDRARTPLVEERLQSQKQNGPWAGVLSAATRDPIAIRELLAYDEDMAAVTLDDLKAAAAKWLSREPMVSRALPAAGRPAAAR